MRDGHIYDGCYRSVKESWHEDRAVYSGGSDGEDKGECGILLRRVMSRKALTDISSKGKGRKALSRGRTPIREVYLAAVLHRTLKGRSALFGRGEVVLLRVRVNEEESPIDLLKPRKAAISPSSHQSAAQLRAHISVVLLIQVLICPNSFLIVLAKMKERIYYRCLRSLFGSRKIVISSVYFSLLWLLSSA